MLSLKFELI